jgi:hypothetical protein
MVIGLQVCRLSEAVGMLGSRGDPIVLYNRFEGLRTKG